MGADDEDDKFASPPEKPRHEVTIRLPFLLGRAPVTFEAWDRFVAATGARAPRDWGWGRGRNPVLDVSWEDALEYLGWFTARIGRRCRLPSEAEWEYACRAGTTGVFSTGTSVSVDQANY